MGVILKIKMPDITATGIVALVGVAVGGYLLYKVSGAVSDAANWVGNKVGEAADATIEAAKTAVDPLSTNKTIVTNPTATPSQNYWNNAWLNTLAAGGMGA